jgi:hypothetical protein
MLNSLSLAAGLRLLVSSLPPRQWPLRLLRTSNAKENAMDFPLLDSQFTNIQLIVTAVVLVAVLLIAVGVFIERRRTRTLTLGNRLGAEYGRAVLNTAPHARLKPNWPTGKLTWRR